MFFIGIDPGKAGALAALAEEEGLRSAEVSKLPFDDSGRLDARAVFEDLCAAAWSGRKMTIVLEHVHSPKGDGHVGAFTFGACFGALLAVCQLVPDARVHLVRPGTWKAKLGVLLPPERNGKSARELNKIKKTLAIDKARELFPHVNLVRPGCRVPDDNMAEALLLAHYGKTYCM